MNTIIRYLLEETSKYECSFVNFLYTGASDDRLFNANIRTLEDLGRECSTLQDSVCSRLSQFGQCSAPTRLLISTELEDISKKLEGSVSKRFSKLSSSVFSVMSNVFQNDHDNRTEDLDISRVSASDQNEDNIIYNGISFDSTIPVFNNWKAVIKQWNEGILEKNLMVPLKDWPGTARTKSRK